MGFACPVCGDPQADGHHLANHLAFTAMLDGGEHEAWLDEHASDWGDADPGELAATVTDHAEETEFPQVFEDTTGDADHDHQHAGDDHAQGHSHSKDSAEQPTSADVLDGASPGDVPDPSELFDADGADDVLAEARELTRRRRANAASEDHSSEDDEGPTAVADDGDSTNDGDDTNDGEA